MKTEQSLALRRAQMEIAAVPLSRLQSLAQSPLAIRLSAFLALMKPRVMLLAVFTAVVGLVIAPDHLDPISAAIAILAIAAGAAAAGVLNMWYDADIDAVMTRTAARPIPRGTISPGAALVLGLALAGAAVLALDVATNDPAAALLAFTIFFYAVVYTMWLKRRTPYNIVIGGAAGALPPMVGWTAVTGHVDLLALYLFAVIFFWTPPHFWALSLLTSQDYARANVPMLPLVMGEGETRRQILLYSILLVAVTTLLFSGRTMGFLYLVAALALGGGLIFYAIRLMRDGSLRRARQLFMYSNVYLALLFVAMAIDRLGVL